MCYIQLRGIMFFFTNMINNFSLEMTRGLLCFSLCLFPGMYAMSDDYNTDISDELLRE